MNNQTDQAGSQIPASPSRTRSRVIRWAEHTLALIGGLLLLLVFTPLTQWLYDGLDRQAPLARARYILCLGGDPARVIEGVRLLSEGYGEKLILSNHDAHTDMMLELAKDWGAPADRILLDRASRTTADHPIAIRDNLHVDPQTDACIIVTSYTHLARSKACFEKAGYQHLILREPRWERQFRPTGGWKYRFRILPTVIYEYAAWAEYYLRGAV